MHTKPPEINSGGFHFFQPFSASLSPFPFSSLSFLSSLFFPFFPFFSNLPFLSFLIFLLPILPFSILAFYPTRAFLFTTAFNFLCVFLCRRLNKS